MPYNKIIYNGQELIDLTGDTVTEDTLAEGATAHDMSGKTIVGKMMAGGAIVGNSYDLIIAQKNEETGKIVTFPLKNLLMGLGGVKVEILQADKLPNVGIESDNSEGGEVYVYFVKFKDYAIPYVYSQNNWINVYNYLGIDEQSVIKVNSTEEITQEGFYLLIQQQNQVIVREGDTAYKYSDGVKREFMDLKPQSKTINIRDLYGIFSNTILADEGYYLQVVNIVGSMGDAPLSIQKDGGFDVRAYRDVQVNTYASLKSALTRLDLKKYIRTDGYIGLDISGFSSLTDIYYEGTIADWKAIKKADEWDYNTGNYTIHCTDGEIKKS